MKSADAQSTLSHGGVLLGESHLITWRLQSLKRKTESFCRPFTGVADCCSGAMSGCQSRIANSYLPWTYDALPVRAATKGLRIPPQRN